MGHIRTTFEDIDMESDVRDDAFNKKLETITLAEYHAAIVKLEDILNRNPNLIKDCCGYDFYLGDKIIGTIYTLHDSVKHWICINPIIMI